LLSSRRSRKTERAGAATSTGARPPARRGRGR
jgi:hypothetical protein